jgi:hypothetical protein
VSTDGAVKAGTPRVGYRSEALALQPPPSYSAKILHPVPETAPQRVSLNLLICQFECPVCRGAALDAFPAREKAKDDALRARFERPKDK